MKRLLRGGRVVDPANGIDAVQDVLLDGSRATDSLGQSVRLVRANLGPVAGFFAGGLLAVVWILGEKYRLSWVAEALPLVAVGLGLLMVSNLPLPKLVLRKEKWLNSVQIASVLGTYVCGLLRVLPEYLAFNVVVYAAVGFTWGAIHRKRLLAYKRLDPYPDE